jgi:hypothetical protein
MQNCSGILSVLVAWNANSSVPFIGPQRLDLRTSQPDRRFPHGGFRERRSRVLLFLGEQLPDGREIRAGVHLALARDARLDDRLGLWRLGHLVSALDDE